jgi:hypothetical protein
MNDTASAEREQATPAVYALGYSDGRRLLHGDGPGSEPLEAVRARYLAHLGARQPTSAGQAYIAGVRDAAADNLPCPPDETEHPRRAA